MADLTAVQVADGVDDTLSVQYNKLLGAILRADFSNATTMTTTAQLTDLDYPIQRFDCNGANRVVKLPAYAVANHPFFIVNVTGATYTLDVQNSAGVTLLALPIEASTGWALLVPDGVAGYRLIASSTGLPASFELASIINPILTVDQNDYNPTGLGPANVMRLNALSAVNITGLAGGSSGRVLIVHNTGTTNITLKTESTLSQAANRFSLVGDTIMQPNMVVILHYDFSSSRWRLIGAGGATVSWGGITGTLTNQTDLAYWLNAPDGTMLNGLFQPSVATGNFTLTLRTRAGNDPSVAEPVRIKINGVWRSITSALSLTIAAGANTFNIGGLELAGNEVDVFIYGSWNSLSSTAHIGLSRLPFARLFGDFSVTATSERYGVFSAAPGAADDVCVIGRLVLINSGTAAFNWSVPTQTSKNLIAAPIFETRELNWAPQFTGLTLGNGTLTAKYMLKGSRLTHHIDFVFGTTSAVTGSITNTLVFARGAGYASYNPVAPARLLHSATPPQYAGLATLGPSSITITAQDSSGTYLKAALLSNLIPFTWANPDEINYEITYLI